jgi:adenosine deaminase
VKWFQRFYLDKEKDIIVDLYKEAQNEPGCPAVMYFVLSTPNHGTGNLIRNLAALCRLPLSEGKNGLLVIRGTVPSYIDGYNRLIYIFRLGDTKVANIYPDKRVEMKAQIPAISKTLMSQTKDYRLDEKRTIVKTYIRSENKFRTDLHTHMNANLHPDILIALGICHQIRYPLYYIKKLGLRCSREQEEKLAGRRQVSAEKYSDCGLTGKYMTRRIDDNTFMNFADLILNDPEDAAFNIPRIRRSLAILKDGQAVFTNLEKVYLYRYVFCKGTGAEDPMALDAGKIRQIPDDDIRRAVMQILADRENPDYRNNTLFQDKLLWIARSYKAQGVSYAEISDTTLVKREGAPAMLAQVHEIMPAVTRETGVILRFLAAIRRIPLTIVKDKVETGDYFRENLETLQTVIGDPYVAGSDIIGEELNSIRDIAPVLHEIVRIAQADPGFVIRIHAGENDGLQDNIADSLECVREALAPGQQMPRVRIGHGLYTPDLRRAKGRALIEMLRQSGAVLEFQITSNVRLNNLSGMKNHPLRQYLAQGIGCVQGTDGGALYGTDSIDEQLSLEKMLGLSDEEMHKMRICEDAVLAQSLKAFADKKAKYESAEQPWTAEIDRRISLVGKRSLPASEVLADRIREMPPDKSPVVIVGGSFSHDNHRTRLTEENKRRIDDILAREDPEKTFFVIGHSMRGYEHYLVRQNKGRFQIFAMVPSMITESEYKKLRTGLSGIRVSIEPVPMGTYKSFAYEIFKRRPSTLIAFDGNIAGANMIQEAKNSRYPCRIYVNSRCKALKVKADSLEGYVNLF